MYVCGVSVMCAVYVWCVLWYVYSVYDVCEEFLSMVSVWCVWYMCHVSECDGGIYL